MEVSAMTSEIDALRSRRAILAAAAGGAAALAASAAMPLAAAAAPVNLQTESDNATGATTSVTDSAADSNAFEGHATGTGTGFGLEGTALGAAGVSGWSVSAPSTYWVDPAFDPDFTNYTGVFGSAPTAAIETAVGTGVWGDSPDVGVYGSGSTGVEGYGGWGVAGFANGTVGSVGVYAQADLPSRALYVDGKAHFTRSGRSTIGAGRSSITINLSGTSSGSRVFAVLHSNRAGRYVRAVVPTTGKFTIYLNTTVTSATYVAWFVLD
jgi:hypothetical protein